MQGKWKDIILKSSLPLEYELKTYLDKQGCISHYDYSYMRLDETDRPKAFSYDIDSAYFKYGHYFDLMFECKYRHKSVSWLFLPEDYDDADEFHACGFMHPMDAFIEYKSVMIHDSMFPETLAPLVGKGLEVLSNDTNSKSIYQATTQLAYSFAEHIADAIVHQVDKLLVKDFVFCHIPIIVTTADLFRMNENVTIRDVENAKDIRDIATEHGILIMKQLPNEELKKHNYSTLSYLAEKREKDLIDHMHWFNKDIKNLFSSLANNPRGFVIIRMTENKEHLDSFFRFLDRAVNPPDELIKAWKANHQRVQELVKTWDERKRKIKENKNQEKK